MTKALDVVRQMIPYNLAVTFNDDVDQEATNPFVQRRCAMHLYFMNGFKVIRARGLSTSSRCLLLACPVAGCCSVVPLVFR